VWTVAGFGSGKASGGGSAPIHFGDTQKPENTAKEDRGKDSEVPEAVAEMIEAVESLPVKVTAKMPAKAAPKLPATVVRKQAAKTTPKSKIIAKKSAKPAISSVKAAAAKPAARKAGR
jgi:hypothetical protein